MGMLFITFYIVFFWTCWKIASIGKANTWLGKLRVIFVFLTLSATPYYVFWYKKASYIDYCKENNPVYPQEKHSMPRQVFFYSSPDRYLVEKLGELGIERIFYPKVGIVSIDDVDDLFKYDLEVVGGNRELDMEIRYVLISISESKGDYFVTEYSIYDLEEQRVISHSKRIKFQWGNYLLQILLPFKFKSCEEYLGERGKRFDFPSLIENTFAMESN